MSAPELIKENKARAGWPRTTAREGERQRNAPIPFRTDHPPSPTQPTQCFDGVWHRYRHASPSTSCDMTFSVFFPPAALEKNASQKPPALIYLSGLTCTDLNVVEKAGAARAAAAAGLVFVAPDTSPRGDGVADDAAWDLGQGAGFYVDATQPPWTPHYRMASYITADLIAALASVGIDTGRLAITGHSMGGHGALTLGLLHPDLFASVSAISPIASAPHCPWGVKALTAYLGPQSDAADAWAAADGAACVRAYSGPSRHILVDVGAADEFLTAGQLLPERLTEAAAGNSGNVSVEVRARDGYDHSYFFIATVIDDHVKHAAAVLVKQ